MEIECVNLVVDRLVRTSEAEEVGRDNATARLRLAGTSKLTRNC
jgi:hypothetical protein